MQVGARRRDRPDHGAHRSGHRMPRAAHADGGVVGAEVGCAAKAGRLFYEILDGAGLVGVHEGRARQLVEGAAQVPHLAGHVGEADHAVLARTLSVVQRGVGGGDERVLVAGIGWEGSRSYGDGHRRRLGGAQSSNRAPDAVAHHGCLGGVHVAEHQRELVASIAEDAVACPRRAGDGGADRVQQRVTRRVAELVVVVLEAVEVHHQQPDARRVRRVRVRVLEQLREIALE